MRHHDRNRKLGRERRQRDALLRGLARSLILHEGITTTEAKAKALRPFVERLVSKAKVASLANTRAVATSLSSADSARKLKDLAKRFEKRAGGYTRITRLPRTGKRVGTMSRIEFVK